MSTPTDPDLDRKLRGLEQMRMAGLISDTRYTETRAALLQNGSAAGAPSASPLPPPPPSPPPAPPASELGGSPPAAPEASWNPQIPAGARSGLARTIAVGVACIVALGALSLIVVGRQTGSNGEWSRSGIDILEDARTNLLAASSVRVTGTLVNGYETDVYDMVEGPHSSTGTLTANGAQLEIRVVGSQVYERGQDFFTTVLGPQLGALIGDQWVSASLGDPALAALGALRLSTLSELFTASGSGTIGKGSTTTVDGHTVGTLEATNGTVTVALDGTADPQTFSGQFTAGSVSARVDFTFSGYGAPMPAVTAPAASLPLPGSSTSS